MQWPASLWPSSHRRAHQEPETTDMHAHTRMLFQRLHYNHNHITYYPINQLAQKSKFSEIENFTHSCPTVVEHIGC